MIGLFSYFVGIHLVCAQPFDKKNETTIEHNHDDYQKKKIYTIAINASSFPYHSVQEAEPIGLMIDLWRLWAKKQQVEVEFVPLPWQETLTQVSLAEIDIHAGLSIIDSRKETLLFSKPLFPLYAQIYIHRDLVSVENVSELKPYAIGVVKGSAHIELLTNKYPQLQQKMYANRTELYDAALKNEIFVFTGLQKIGKDYADYELLNHQFPAHKRLRYQQGQYAIAVAKSNAALLSFVEQGFDKITALELATIERKWLGIEKSKNSLLVVFTPNYSPYMALSPSGKPQGLFIDVWRLWSKQTGINIEFVAREIEEDIKLIKQGSADVFLVYPEKGKKITGTLLAKPIYHAQAQVYLPKHRKDITSLKQFENNTNEYLVGIWNYSPFKEQLLTQFPDLNVRFFSSINEMLKAADRNEISAMISLVDLMNAKLVQSNLQSSFYRLAEPSFTVELSPLVSQDNPKMLETINAGFAELDIEQLITIESRWVNGGKHFYKSQANKIKLTEQEQRFLKKNNPVRMGVLKDLSPVEFVNEHGEFSGINRDIIELVSERTGLHFQYIYYENWQQVYQAIIDNNIDLISSVTMTKKRQEEILFTDSYWSMPWVIMHPHHLGKQTKLRDFYGKQLAIVKGYYLISQLRKQHPLITFKVVNDRKQAQLALQQGKVDGFVTTIATATELLKKESLVTLMISIMESVSLDKSHFGVNKQSPLLKTIINKGLLSVTEKDKQAIYDNWFTVNINTGIDRDIVIQVGIQVGVIILFIIIMIVMWNRRLHSEVEHRKQLELIMKHMATHDELTGLANRVLLKDRLNTALEFHFRHSLQIAVMFIDLDGFKNINDTYGHDVGDELLKIVAQRLQGCVRKSDTVARFGGDEFVILLTGLHCQSEAAYVADKVLQLIQEEFELSQAKAKIGCSIGISVYPDDGDNTTDLVKIADTLMYQVKAAGKNHYIFNAARDA